MAEDVTLFFSAFPGSNAIGLQIEESENGVDGWTQILNTDEIGESPDWVTSYTVQATSIEYWFRIRWQLEQPDSGGPLLFTEYSAPVKGSDLPFHWTVPDLYRSVSFHELTGWTNVQIQMLIDRSYYLIQNLCGPYDETLPGFGDVAQLVIHSVMDRMQPTLGPLGVGAFAGLKSEVMGSYEYERFDNALAHAMSAFVVPPDLAMIICPFGVARDGPTLLTTTHVFSETDYVLAGSDDTIKVVTTLDRAKLAPSVDPYAAWWRWID